VWKLGLKPADKKVADDVRRCGWHCLHVSPRLGEKGASFTYTLGLVASYGHPELMIFGLGREKSHGVLAECVDMIKSGRRFPINEPVSGVLARNFQVVFKSIRKECFSEYLGTAIRYYGHQDFEAYVMFWPDAENHFVWSSKNLSVQMEALEVVR
jgi:Domain of unknown function (DUF4262)